MNRSACLSALVLLLGAPFASAQAPETHYHIANRLPLAGDGSFDLLAVDSATGRVYLSHGTVVQVIDTGAGTLLGTISDTNGVHGIALAPELGKGFITCGKDNTVAIFDLKTLAVAARVPSGTNPDAIVYEPATQRVFAFNGRSNDATVIDAKTNEVAGTVKLDGKPELAATDGQGTVFVNLEDKSMVVRIDAKTLAVKAQWSVAPGEEPSGLALDPATQRLFIGCHNKLMVVASSEDGHVITTLPIGERVDGVGFDAALHRAYSSNGDGTLTVVDEQDKDTFAVLETVATQLGAKTLAVDGRTHRVFLPAAAYDATPAATAENPRPRPPIKPGSFVLLTVEPVTAAAQAPAGAGSKPQ